MRYSIPLSTVNLAKQNHHCHGPSSSPNYLAVGTHADYWQMAIYTPHGADRSSALHYFQDTIMAPHRDCSLQSGGEISIRHADLTCLLHRSH